MGLKRYLPPALALLLLSPAVGEVLSSSTPPLAVIFNPLGTIFLLFLYGGGAIIIRELALRWQKSWPSILIMGAAYGIVEEGLMVKTFFNPGLQVLGILGSYGRWLGVNWAWSVELAIFHAVFSITIPILLVTLAYPEKRTEPWVGRRMLFTLGILLIGTVILGYFLLYPYPVPPALILSALVGVAILMAVAGSLPNPLFTVKAAKAPKPRWFLFAGFVWGTALFMITWLVPPTGLNPLITLALFILSVIALAFAVLKMSGNGGAWSDKHRLALAAGVLGFLILLSPVFELKGVVGASVAGILFSAMLISLYLGLGRREKESTLNPDPGVKDV